MSSDCRLTTGQFAFDGGVDSSKVPLVQSAQYSPQGLSRNQLAWLSNGTVRGGGILQRTGYQPLCTVHDGSAIYQRGWLYDATSVGGNPYLMLSIGGRMYQVRVDTDNSVHDVTGAFADPPTAPKAWFAQQGRWMIKQAGDGVTLPLFWDGNGMVLRRSKGITNSAVVPGTPGVNELPAATAMVGYMARIWYAQNRKVSAGDVEGGNSGVAPPPWNKDDAVLNVTENPLAVGGDGFSLPGTAGNVRALNFPIALDQTLGEGPLFIFTPKQIYSLVVPVTRTDWIAATSSNQPLLRVVMKTNGTVSDTSVVQVNGDLWYQSLDPGIRSYFMALRYFQTWGNGLISNNINRILQFNDRSLMHMASGMEFGSRMYQTALPVQTSVGIAFQSLVVMDFDPLSTLQDQRPPAWEGASDGLQFLQVFSGDFGGRERAFAVVHSSVDGSIQVWEISSDQRFENGDSRVSWYAETPSMDWSEFPRSSGGGPFSMKELDGIDIWIDKLFGTADITVQYRPDQDPCWTDWFSTRVCAARTCQESVDEPCAYPIVGFREQYRTPISFPKPINPPCQTGNPRPATWGFSFQLKFIVKGWLRIRGYQLHALPKETGPFYNQVCSTV